MVGKLGGGGKGFGAEEGVGEGGASSATIMQVNFVKELIVFLDMQRTRNIPFSLDTPKSNFPFPFGLPFPLLPATELSAFSPLSLSPVGTVDLKDLEERVGVTGVAAMILATAFLRGVWLLDVRGVVTIVKAGTER